MKHGHFLKALDHTKITAAIAAAETDTSGQIRVFVSRQSTDDAVRSARERFTRLGMEKTARRNAVLVFIAPAARRYAVVGDQGIHAQCGGDEFWRALVGDVMRPLLKEGRYTDALVAAVERVGRELAVHFPREAGEKINELPDAVAED